MNNNVEKCVIGVDAGGTKTRAAVYDKHGNLLSSAVSGCGNLALSYEVARNSIIGSIRSAIDGAGIGIEYIDYIAVGAAGGSSATLANRLSAELTKEFGAKTDVMSDALLAMNAAFGANGNGMLVISGTGSVVFVRQNGVLLRAGGWGHILGDGGSAYYTGLCALRQITRLRDENNPDISLERAVFDVIGIGDISELVPYVYSPERQKSDIAKIAPAVNSLAESGNCHAADILLKSASSLSDDAVSVLRRCNAREIEVALYGGHIRNSRILRENFKSILCEKVRDLCTVRFISSPPDPTSASYQI